MGERDLKPYTCLRCSGAGYRGMDRCNICDCTGSVFRVGDDVFPNTKEGYIEACTAAGITPILETEDRL